MISDQPEGGAVVVPETIELAVTTGTHRFAGVGAGRKFKVTRKGIEFLGKMNLDQWREMGKGLFLFRDMFHIALADWQNAGKEWFGEQVVDQTLELFNCDMSDALKAHAIGQLPLDLRTEYLTGEHYYVLSTMLPNAKKEQGRWAALADREKLTVLELKKSIAAGKVVRTEQIDRQSGRDSGIPNLEGMAMLFQRWQKQAGGEEKILEQPVDWKLAFLNEVDPIVDVALKVRETLPPEAFQPAVVAEPPSEQEQIDANETRLDPPETQSRICAKCQKGFDRTEPKCPYCGAENGEETQS